MPKGKYKRSKTRKDSSTELDTLSNTLPDYEPEPIVSLGRDKMRQPVREEQRICFGIMWFMSAREAIAAHEIVRKQGRTINGGYFDGMPCGRAPEWDYEDEDGNKFYAVTN